MKWVVPTVVALLAGCGQRFEVRGEVGFGSAIGEYLPKVKGEVIYEAGNDLRAPDLVPL